MPRNGFFGVKNSHIAIFKDEDEFTYETPVKVPGTVEIKMEPSVETNTSYADNEPWIDKTQDNGGSGTISFYDTESTTELRKLFADLLGSTSMRRVAFSARQARRRRSSHSCASSLGTSSASAAASSRVKSRHRAWIPRRSRTSLTLRSSITT